ncbi:MFS transporter [Novosphingobium sp. 11B]
MAVVFLFFTAVGLALPVLPLHVHDTLGFGPFVVGLVAGGQFVAALVSRFWAGRLADTRGPKQAVSLGLIAAVASGVCYLGSLALLPAPLWSVTVLIVGRTLLGGAESLVITGGMLWALGLAPADRSAQVIAWVGMAMFAALAAGAPLGSLLYGVAGFIAVATTTLILPLVSLVVALQVRPYIPSAAPTGRWQDVLRAVLWPGIGFSLSGITFGAVTAFLTLYFATQGWPHGALAFTAFAIALIGARLVGGHLPDRHGGAQVASVCLIAQALGLAIVGLAGSAVVAIVGVVIAGAGFSLVFPSLGLEAVRRTPPEQRGLAIGTYNAFLDLTLGIGSPLLGWVGGHAGLGSVFVVSAVAALFALPIALLLRSRADRIHDESEAAAMNEVSE